MADLILFDIDGTLFNPEAFGKKIRARFTQILNASEEELIRINADYYSGLETSTDFNPHDITEFISQRLGVDKSALDKVFWEEEGLYRGSVFEEVVGVLTQLKGDKKLGIYSQGNTELQKRKLFASGIEKYFDKEFMFFHSRKVSDEALDLLPGDATIIDDNHEVVNSLKDRFEIIWINRRSEECDPGVKTIHLLTDLLS